jgi:O-methyltransferase
MLLLLKKIFNQFVKYFGYSIYNIHKTDDYIRIQEISNYENELINKCKKYSMTPKLRMWALIQSFHHIVNKKIEGEFVECGIWKGGNIILLLNLLEKFNIKRKVYGFDTFEGMSEPSSVDIKYNQMIAKDIQLKNFINQTKWNYSSIEDVKKNIKNNTANYNQSVLIKGKVENTLLDEKNIPNKISILRLDTDFYESTKIELDVLYKRLSIGGVLIIDDYGNWLGAKKAVDEFFNNKKTWLHYIDRTCRLLIKDH